MYESFYKLNADPFMMSPDHRFAFGHEAYVKARSYLEYGLFRGEGLVVITGAPGTGKSTVIDDLLSQYGGEDLVVARVLTTQLEVNELLRMVAYSFGIHVESMDKASVLIRIQEFLRAQYARGKRVLLIVDEAQNLSTLSLEELRLLTNIQHEDELRFQIFLLGQPQLQNLIRGPGMDQLRQRIIASTNFEPLTAEEARGYIAHRLTVAGWQGDPQITGAALELIHRFSSGIPRRINTICGRLLLHGRVDEKHRLDASDVREVLKEMPPEMVEQTTYRKRPEPAKPSSGGAVHRTDNKYERWYSAYRKNPPSSNAQANVLEEQVVSKPLDEPESEPQEPNTEHIRLEDLTKSATPAETAQSSSEATQVRPQSADDDTVLLANHELTRAGAQWTETASTLEPSRTDPEDEMTTTHRASLAYFEDEDPEPAPARSGLSVTTAAILFVLVLAGTYALLDWYWNNEQPAPQSAIEPHRSADKPPELPTPNSTEGPTPPEVSQPQELAMAESGEADPADAPLSAGENEPNEPEIHYEPLPEPTAESATVQSMDAENGADALVTPNTSANPPVESPAPKAPQAPTPSTTPPQRKPVTSRAVDPGVVQHNGRLVVSPSLEQALRLHASNVKRLNDGSVKITMNRELSFKSGSALLGASTTKALDELAFVLRNYSGFSVKVVAHTDTQGADAHNLYLSKLRARAVVDYLVANGLPAERTQAEGKGESEPLASNAGLLNRRIEIFVQPSA